MRTIPAPAQRLTKIGHAGQTIGSRHQVLILLKEELASPDDVDGNAGILRDLAGLAVVNLAEGIDA